MENETQTSRILHRILALMPPPGHWNTDAEAAEMVRKMNQIVEEEFSQSAQKESS